MTDEAGGNPRNDPNVAGCEEGRGMSQGTGQPTEAGTALRRQPARKWGP